MKPRIVWRRFRRRFILKLHWTRYTMRRLFVWAAFIPWLAFASVAAGSERGFSRSALAGVWEPVAFESALPRRPRDPARKENCKYCFSADTAYPCLSADSAGDSADGGGPYFLVDGDILVVRTGVPGGIWTYQIVSLTRDKLVWQEGSLRVILRRIAKVWKPNRAPRIRCRDIPIAYHR